MGSGVRRVKRERVSRRHYSQSGDPPMIRHKLLIASVISATVVISACSDVTAPKARAVAGPPVALLTTNAADAGGVTVVATINGGGTGVGHWTLDVPHGFGGFRPLCDELLTSGQILIRWE